MAFLSAQGHLVDAEGDCSAVLQHLHTSVRGCRVSSRFVLQVFAVRTRCGLYQMDGTSCLFMHPPLTKTLKHKQTFGAFSRYVKSPQQSHIQLF